VDQKLSAIRAGLLEHCIEVQALSNRMLHASPEHRAQARTVRLQAFELSKLIRSLAPSTVELEALDTFFPTGHGRKVDNSVFLHLEGD
jgi:hypothetical protein